MRVTQPLPWRFTARGLGAALVLGLALGMAAVACSPADTDRCAGINCGVNGVCVVVGGAPRCECALTHVQVGSQCVAADGGVDAQTPCGNGVADEGEICDGQDLRGSTCASLGFTGGGTLACRPSCDYFDTRSCATVCGDGLAGGTEVCDGTDFGNQTCESLGYHGGDLSCTAACEYDVDSCSGRCGDGIVQLTHEACDGTNLAGGRCNTLGYHSGAVSCDADCDYDISGCQGHCGDGVVQPAYESCEGSDLDGATCELLGYSEGGTLACEANCDFDVSDCLTVCGNGIVDVGEVCDDGNNQGGDGCAADCSVGQGRIVFVSDRTGFYEVWTMTDDGSNIAQLTFIAGAAGACAGAHNPRWSPDGSRVAFRYGGDSVGCPTDPTIYVMNADGSGLMPVLQTAINGGLAWTRDGSHIVYTAGAVRTLRIVGVDGSGDATLFDGANEEMDPDFHPSPLVDRLVYSQYMGGGDYAGIFSVNANGSSLLGLAAQCASGCDLRSARWSSNGTRVLFHRGGAIVWVNANGTGEATVLSGGADVFVDWLTDSRVVFQTPLPNVDLTVVNIDGTGSQVLTSAPGFDGEPDWHPGQRDLDLDGVLDWADNCVSTPNASQSDVNWDGVGDACD